MDTSIFNESISQELSLFASPTSITSSLANEQFIGHHLVIVDSAVSLSDQQLSGLLETEAEVIQLDANQDGIEQITDILVNRENLESLHIFSHGSPGSLQLGNEELNLESLANYQDSLLSWDHALTEEADILLYGCELGQGSAGSLLIEQLGILTKADIAASDDLTGSAELNGDWDLELQTGEIEATSLVIEQFEGILGDVDDSQQVLHLDFDQIDGLTAIDTSGSDSQNNGILRNNTNSQYTTDPDNFQGGIVELSGDNSGIDVANSTEINTSSHAQRSVVINFKADDKDAGRQVLYEEGGGGRGLNIYLDEGQLYVGGWNRTGEGNWSGTYLTTEEIETNQWNQVILTLDARAGETTPQENVFTGYLNGTKFDQGAGSELLARPNGTGIGNINGQTRFHDTVSSDDLGFNGSIGEVQIFNRVLNANEIATLSTSFTDDSESTPRLLNSEFFGFENENDIQYPKWYPFKGGKAYEDGVITIVENGDSFSGEKQLYMKLPKEATTNYEDQISISKTFPLSAKKLYRVEAQVKWLNPENSLDSAIISLWATENLGEPDQQNIAGKDFEIFADENGETKYEQLKFEFTPNEDGNILTWLGLLTHRDGPGETQIHVDDFKIFEMRDIVKDPDDRTDNLLENHDFSQGLDSWTTTEENPKPGLKQSIVSENGSEKLRLELPGTTIDDSLNNTWTGVYQTVTLNEGVTYELSANFDRIIPDHQRRSIVNVYAYRPEKVSETGEILSCEQWIGPVDYDLKSIPSDNKNHRQTFEFTPTETDDYRITFRVFGWANDGLPVTVDIDDVKLKVV